MTERPAPPLHWPTFIDQLRRGTEYLIHKGADWLIPEDEAMVESCVELVLDGQDVADVAKSLGDYFDLDAADDAALREALTAAQSRHLADPHAQNERHTWALAASGKL